MLLQMNKYIYNIVQYFKNSISRQANCMQESRYKMNMPNCQICNKVYDMYYHIPRVLPKCGHTYCEKCIKSKLANKKGKLTFSCPQCQSDTIVRKNVADQLPKNISIAQLVKDVKYKNLEQEAQSQPQAHLNCPKHNKKLEMVCIQCGNMKICPHCAIFGDHKGHNIGNQAGATQQDIQDLKQVLNLVQQTVNNILLPNSPMNIQTQAKNRLTMGLQSYIRQNFKAYTIQINKKQQELLQQCSSVAIEEKGSEYLDNILTSFDILKIKGGEISKGINSRSEVDQIIQNATELHSEIERIKQSYNKSIDNFLQQSKRKIKECVFFDIQAIERRNLKAILKGQMSPEIKRKQKQKLKQGSAKIIENKKQDHVQKKLQIKQALERKNTDTFLGDKNQSKSRIVNASGPSSSRVKTQKVAKSFALEKKQQDLSQNISNTSHTQSRPPQNPQSQAVRKNYNSLIEGSQDSQTGAAGQQVKTLKSSSIRKTEGLKSPPKQNLPNRSRSKSPIKLIEQGQLKFIKPNKQLNYELRPKFQTICDQIDRQQPEGPLQLIGMEICDQLVAYICDYLTTKKLKFSMIKLVKNNITDQGFRTLLSYLTNDNFTKVLNVTSNHLTYKSLASVVNFIGHNNILKTIYLSNNKISPMQLKKIQSSLESKFVQVVL